MLLVVREGVDREMVGSVRRGFEARERSGKVRKEMGEEKGRLWGVEGEERYHGGGRRDGESEIV